MDLFMAAKCGLLDNMVAGTFWLPLMPTVLIVTAVVLAHVTGRTLSHFLGFHSLNLKPAWQVTRAGLSAAAVILVVLIAWRGIAYPLFLLRMGKDAYQCSYFEAGRDLHTVQLIMFGLAFIVQTLCVMGFNHRHWRATRSRPIKVARLTTYTILAPTAYGLVLTLDPAIAPLLALFAVPLAYCGLGMLGRFESPKMSLSQAVQAAETEFKGKAVSASLDMKQPNTTFVVEVMSAGGSQSVSVDSETGKLTALKTKDGGEDGENGAEDAD